MPWLGLLQKVGCILFLDFNHVLASRKTGKIVWMFSETEGVSIKFPNSHGDCKKKCWRFGPTSYKPPVSTQEGANILWHVNFSETSLATTVTVFEHSWILPRWRYFLWAIAGVLCRSWASSQRHAGESWFEGWAGHGLWPYDAGQILVNGEGVAVLSTAAFWSPA